MPLVTPLFKSLFFTSLLSVFLLALAAVDLRAECPFCSAVSQTIRQEMDQSDTVAFAKLVPGSESEVDALFQIQAVLRGGSFATEGQEVRVNYFGNAKPDQTFMLMGVDPPDMLWSSPLPVSSTSIDYAKAVALLPAKDSMARLNFFLKYLENEESLIARDAYDEFASAPYEEIKLLKPKMDRELLLKWIQDTSLPQERKRLYLVMLGVCGEPADAKLLEEMLRSEDADRRGGMDAMIACYATLKGESGLDLIDELFLTNKKSQYADTYQAIMALRFHGSEGGVISKDRVLQSMRLILDRPELADLVISDLARWEDWSQMDKLVTLFKQADEKTSWLRVPVINYLRACPLPAAEEKLVELKELDPAAFKRAVSFFPAPKSGAPGTTDSSFVPRSNVWPLGAISNLPTAADDGQQFASMGSTLPSRFGSQIATTPASSPNRITAISVVSMASLTLWLAMWLSISGTNKSGLIASLLTRHRN